MNYFFHENSLVLEIFHICFKRLSIIPDKMETMQVFIKTEDEEKENDTMEQHAQSLAEETTSSEPFKSER